MRSQSKNWTGTSLNNTSSPTDCHSLDSLHSRSRRTFNLRFLITLKRKGVRPKKTNSGPLLPVKPRKLSSSHKTNPKKKMAAGKHKKSRSWKHASLSFL